MTVCWKMSNYSTSKRSLTCRALPKSGTWTQFGFHAKAHSISSGRYMGQGLYLNRAIIHPNHTFQEYICRRQFQRMIFCPSPEPMRGGLPVREIPQKLFNKCKCFVGAKLMMARCKICFANGSLSGPRPKRIWWGPYLHQSGSHIFGPKSTEATEM